MMISIKHSVGLWADMAAIAYLSLYLSIFILEAASRMSFDG